MNFFCKIFYFKVKFCSLTLDEIIKKQLILHYEKFESFISKPRLDRFLNACNGCQNRTQNLYQANLKIAESYYSILNLFEIFLRNKINSELTNHFGNADWILKEKNGFMNDIVLEPSKYFLRNQVQTAIKRATLKRKAITSGAIIAEQSLGFWTSLFETHHYKLLSGKVIHSFPNRPNEIQRKQISSILFDIREFRNRVYHNEPICFKDNLINFDDALKIKSEIYDVLNWMDADLAIYTAKFDSIDTNITEALKI